MAPRGILSQAPRITIFLVKMPLLVETSVA